MTDQQDSGDEIVVTPEMILAGLRVLDQGREAFADHLLVERVYIAMALQNKADR